MLAGAPGGTLTPGSDLMPGYINWTFPESTLGLDWAQTIGNFQGPIFTEHLAWLVDSLAAEFESVAQLVAQTGEDGDPDYVPPWGTLFNVDTCPTEDLGYLGQYVGVSIDPNAADAVSRGQIQAEVGMQRGTTASLVNAATQWLTEGAPTPILIQRMRDSFVPDPDWFVIIVQTGTVANQNALVAAVNAVKPAGQKWQLLIQSAWTWSEALNTWNADTMTFDETATIRP